MDHDSHNGRRPTRQDVERYCGYLNMTKNLFYHKLETTYLDNTENQMNHLTELFSCEKEINATIAQEKYEDANDLALLVCFKKRMEVGIARKYKILESLKIQFFNDIIALYEKTRNHPLDISAFLTQNHREEKEIALVAESALAALQPSNAEVVESVDAPITRANLTLKHDGKVYTYPECMEGVPVEKIHREHPYLKSAWTDIATRIKSELDVWREQLDSKKSTKEPYKESSLARKVNQGEAILKFLEEADFYPYQLVAKKYMTIQLATHSTIYRLAHILQTLKGFKTLDITPLEWLRQRLQQIITKEGSRFNLAKTIRNIHRDPKYVTLRESNGRNTMDRSKIKNPDHPRKRKDTTNDPNPRKRQMTQASVQHKIDPPRKRKAVETEQSTKFANIPSTQKAQVKADEIEDITAESNDSYCPIAAEDCIVVAFGPSQ
ncbi:hypothetical protein CDEST_02005 [Colletotrichum destructivum]|uniref:Uncharacterized protein n=1 Tax=Colletotrichum destructivum TaxID=34406 RepID=A0AAX4I1M5_9PEZI|nr:hypothetical protein CDEST_02005 [Colletotrichum destructivum]